MGKTREQIQVYLAPEPDVSVGQVAVAQTLTRFETLLFTYPDRPHDAETLMIDPTTGDLLIVTKEDEGKSSVFRAPAFAADGHSWFSAGETDATIYQGKEKQPCR